VKITVVPRIVISTVATHNSLGICYRHYKMTKKYYINNSLAYQAVYLHNLLNTIQRRQASSAINLNRLNHSILQLTYLPPGLYGSSMIINVANIQHPADKRSMGLAKVGYKTAQDTFKQSTPQIIISDFIP
jgi:hypothetical protein